MLTSSFPLPPPYTPLSTRPGTTTATVLARAILNEGCKSVAAGMNPMDLRRGINTAVDNVLQACSSVLLLLQCATGCPLSPSHAWWCLPSLHTHTLLPSCLSAAHHYAHGGRGTTPPSTRRARLEHRCSSRAPR
jgi:hypothetical protein